jgi:uncharacterized protein YfaQ (DUF2300 family)
VKCGGSFSSEGASHRVCNKCRPAWESALREYGGESYWSWRGGPAWAREDEDDEDE